jgi:hypothetical protein
LLTISIYYQYSIGNASLNIFVNPCSFNVEVLLGIRVLVLFIKVYISTRENSKILVPILYSGSLLFDNTNLRSHFDNLILLTNYLLLLFSIFLINLALSWKQCWYIEELVINMRSEVELKITHMSIQHGLCLFLHSLL